MPRPALVRYSGLAGSALLAVAAYRGGARSLWQPTMTPGTIFAGDQGVLLPLCWLAGTLLLIGAWWAGRRVVPSTRWALVTAALWAVPLLPMLPLASYDVYSYACQGYVLAAGHDPYSAGVRVLGCPWVDAVSPTWRDAPAPYGPVYLALAAVAATVGGSLTGTLAVLRVVAVLGVVLTAVGVLALAGDEERRKKAVWLVLACPLVGIHLISGAHNDALMVGLLVAGIAVGRRNPLAAGVLLGLAVGVKATAVVVLPFVVLMAVPGRRVRAALTVGAGAVGVLAAVSWATGLGLGWITNLSDSGASVQWTSPSTAVGLTIKLITGYDAVPVTRIAGVVLLAGVLAVLWWRARTGDVLLHAGLALAATVVLAPIFHPWYAIWPLAVLATHPRGDSRWLLLPCAVAAVLCLPDGYNLALATRAQGAVLMTALIIFLATRQVRRA